MAYNLIKDSVLVC